MDWWPITRDCIAYGFTVAVLICIIHDERVEWYEALILVLLYFVYIGVMYFDKTIQKWAKGKMIRGFRSNFLSAPFSFHLLDHATRSTLFRRCC